MIERLTSFPILVLYAFLLALVSGLGTAYWAVGSGSPFGAVRLGAWTAWPRAGSAEADPYTRAAMARTSDLPLGAGEGIGLTAVADYEDRALEARCTYRFGSRTPQARAWTLTVYDASGNPAQSTLGRNNITSSEVLRDSEGGFLVLVSREAQSGNWLAMPGAGGVSLTLRLYDTPASVGAGATDPQSLPKIERVTCLP